MTNQEYIVAKLARFGVTFSANDLAAMAADGDISLAGEYTAANAVAVKTCLAGIIPELLTVTSVSEGGYSIARDKDALLAYYAMLCDELHIPNKLKAKPAIKDHSNKW